MHQSQRGQLIPPLQLNFQKFGLLTGFKRL